ncbi:MAG: AAA family ATPase [Patescibacteria group bacterium]|jgi:dephospho-CoA kinase
MIIGIVGSIASGKDTVLDYLRGKGFRAVSLSDVLRGIMRSEGEEIDIPNMTRYGNNLRNEKGHGYLTQKALEEIGDSDAVITSIRQVGEIEVLRQRSDFVLVKLDAPIEMRLDRIIKRGREGDIKNMEELREIEAKQADGKEGAMNMNRCYELADIELINDGTIEELYAKVDKLIAEIKN